MTQNGDFSKGSIIKILMRLAIPMTLAQLMNVLYNVVDRMFIGRIGGDSMDALTGVGVCLPMITIVIAFANLVGMGGAPLFSIERGRKNDREAVYILGNCVVLFLIFAVVLTVAGLIFKRPLLMLLGASEVTLPYAEQYITIYLLGTIFVMFGLGLNNFINAQGFAKIGMCTTVIGAALNIALDPIFIFGLQMGMRGAALATIIGQIVSFCISLRYMFHFKTIRLTKESFHMTGRHIENIFKFGASACFNQIAMTIVQIVLNNTLSHYGAQSVYGGDIPLACAGIITKVNMIFMSFVIGISQGIQPIIGFNYGAEKYERVRKSYLLALGTATVLSGIAFFCFQVFPRQIISVFGSGSELYFQFSERYFRIYMFLTLINGIQPVTSNFFNSIGKSQLGVFMSLTRQILFLLPLIVIFPLFMGIDGVMYAGPIADAAAAIVCGYFMVRELKELSAMDRKKKEEYAA